MCVKNNIYIKLHIPTTNIPASLNIFDITGKKVKSYYQLTDNQILWDGKDENNIILPEGIYFCVLKVDDLIETKKIVLVK